MRDQAANISGRGQRVLAYLKVSIASRRIMAGLLMLAALPSAVVAQSGPRRERAPPLPPLDASFPPTVASCGATYGLALSTKVVPAMAADQSRAAMAIAGLSPTWPGRWLTADPTGKQAKAAALAAAEARTQQRICTERTKRAGRVSCAKWQEGQSAPAPTAAEVPIDLPTDAPPVVAKVATVPPAIDDELRDLKLLTGFVAAKGQLIEFGRNGRLEGLLKRSTGDLAAYAGQPAHPALCNGVPPMLDFHLERMEPVQTRLTAITELAGRTRTLAERRVAAAIKLADADTRGKPLTALSAALSHLMLPVDTAGMTAPLAELPVQLRRLVEASKTLPWIAEPAETQVAVAQALRALEAAFYAEAQATRADAVAASLFGAMTLVRDTHAARCTCAE